MGKTYNVLIIEAAKNEAENYTQIINQILDCRTHHCDSAEKALELLKKINEYDLILLDYDLPTINDVNLLQLIKEKKILLSGPTIIVTSSGKDDITLHLMRWGISDYIAKKDITVASLSAIIHTALEKQQIKLAEQKNYSNYNIIIIEDSIDDFELYSRIIKKIFNCSITHFTSAEKALDALEHEAVGDVILVDYNLPGMNGINFISTMRQKNIAPECPLIVLTGQGNENIAINFMRLGITDYIQKNHINFESLSVSIQNAFEKNRIRKMQTEKQKELLLFAHTLAHDLKNPITRIQVYSKLLSKNPDNASTYITNIAEDSEFLMQFIDQLLMYAEYGRGDYDKKEVDLNMVLKQSIRNLDNLIEDRQAIIEVTGEWPKIYGSEISLIQLFQNIISNSIKYTLQTPLIKINCNPQKEFIIISILDNGIGIPPEEVGNIFKPFHRISNDLNALGTGLGLALVKTIADQHGAKMHVKPGSEGGTQFDIMFHL